MTTEEIKAIIGDLEELDEEDWADLEKASLNDPEEGAEMLPRYKVALHLLVCAYATTHGALQGVAMTNKGTTLEALVNGSLLQAKEFYDAHLKFCIKGN